MFRHLPLAVTVALIFTTSVFAATMTVSTTTPTVDGADIAQVNWRNRPWRK